MTDTHHTQPENDQTEDDQTEDDQPGSPIGDSTNKSADEPLKALRAIIISCLVFYLIFALALPKLREVGEEEQIIPDLVTWSALEGVLRREAAAKASELGINPGWNNLLKAY